MNRTNIHRPGTRAVVAVASLALVAAACGGDDDDAADPTDAPAPATEPAPANFHPLVVERNISVAHAAAYLLSITVGDGKRHAPAF